MSAIYGEQISLYRMATLKAGLSLELKGLSKHGRSCYSVIKEEFKLKGNKQKVFDQFSEMYENEKKKAGIVP